MAETKTEEQLTVILPDQACPAARGLKVKVCLEHGFLHIVPEGYGEPDAADGDGAPVFLEVYEGRLRVIVTPDINEENNRRIIDLEGARESLRTPLEQ
jgi:hypothetical protein